MDLIKMSAKVKERLEAVRTRDEESKVYRLETDRLVRRSELRANARALRREGIRSRRAFVARQTANDITAAQARILSGDHDPAAVSPALVRNVQRAAVRAARARTQSEHPEWTAQQVDVAVVAQFTDMGLDGNRFVAGYDTPEVAV